MTYQYGQTHARMSDSTRLHIFRLEALVRDQQDTIRRLRSRLNGHSGIGGPTYISTLEPDEMKQRPDLHPGDTPQACQDRLEAAAAEAEALERRNRQAARAANEERRKATLHANAQKAAA